MSIPLTGKSNIADHMVIASGRSTRQVASMAAKLADKIKEQFGRNVRIEGLPAADWVLIDADDVIVHIFRPEVRNFYNLERMWAFGDESERERSCTRVRAHAYSLHFLCRCWRLPRSRLPRPRRRASTSLEQQLSSLVGRQVGGRRHCRARP